MKFSVTILGCGAASPTLLRNSSAQLVDVHDKLFLVDCGEGTQLQLRRHKAKFQRIHQIFISHLHGDHYLGLMGLLSSMHLLGRGQALQVHGPAGLKELIDVNLKHSRTRLSFPLEITETDTKNPALVYEDDTLSITSFPLKHRIPCTGFLFREKERDRKMIKSYIDEMSIGLKEIIRLKRGEDVTRDTGEVLVADKLTQLPEPPRSFAYCSDTGFDLGLAEILKGVNLLYHEATFGNELEERAKTTLHSTAKQAALVAEASEVGKLVLGHFSSRYPNTDNLLAEAKAVFSNTEVAKDGSTFDVFR